MTVAPPETSLPTPAEADHLLARISDPTRSLADIAAEFGVPLPALTLWLTQPEIAARIDAIENFAARRARLVATDQLPAAVHTLTAVLKNYLAPAPEAPAPSPEHAQRRAETARKAAALIIRLSSFRPPAPRAAAPSPLPGNPPARRPTSPLRLAALDAILAHQAGEQAPPPPRVPSSSPPSPGPDEPPASAPAASSAPGDQASPVAAHFGPLVHALLSIPPESVDPSDPATRALLERLAAISDDTPPEEAERLVTQFVTTVTTREAG